MPLDISQAIPIGMVGGFAYALGRLTQRVTAVSRAVASELRRITETFTQRFDGIDARMRFIEELLAHAHERGLVT